MFEQLQIFFGLLWAHFRNNRSKWVSVLLIMIVVGYGMIPASSESKEGVEAKRENSLQCAAKFDSLEHLSAVPGDLIEIERWYDPFGIGFKVYGQYDHWVVFMGNFEVMHLVPNTKNGIRDEVRKDKIEDVVKGSPCRVNNQEGPAAKRQLKASSKTQIIIDCHKHMKEFNAGKSIHGGKYSLLKFNCEHFATLCRYGEAFSEMTTVLEGKPRLKLAAAGVGLAVDQCS